MRRIYYFITLWCVALVAMSCNTHKYASTYQDDVKESQLFYEPEQQPYYLHGGSEGLFNDLYTAILKTAPVTQDSVSGQAIVTFKITKQGIIDSNSIKVIRNRAVPDDYMSAAIEAIKNLDKFEPGKMNGTPVTVEFTLPIKYPVPKDKIKTSE